MSIVSDITGTFYHRQCDCCESEYPSTKRHLLDTIPQHYFECWICKYCKEGEYELFEANVRGKESVFGIGEAK